MARSSHTLVILLFLDRSTLMVNVKAQFEKIDKYFSPKIIGEVNNTFIKLAKIKGDAIPWHNHANEDEMFYVIQGKLLFEEENQSPFEMGPGDFYIVKRGINHRVSSIDECHIMLVEPKSTAHLGTTESHLTKSIEDQLR